MLLEKYGILFKGVVEAATNLELYKHLRDAFYERNYIVKQYPVIFSTVTSNCMKSMIMSIGSFFVNCDNTLSLSDMVRWIDKNLNQFEYFAILNRSMPPGVVRINKEIFPMGKIEFEELFEHVEKLKNEYNNSAIRKFRNKYYSHVTSKQKEQEELSDLMGVKEVELQYYIQGTAGIWEDIFSAYFFGHKLTLLPAAVKGVPGIKIELNRLFNSQ